MNPGPEKEGERVDATSRFLAAAAGLGLDIEPRSYPQGTRTAADAAAAIGCEVDQIVKSLVFVTQAGATRGDEAQTDGVPAESGQDGDGRGDVVLALTAGGRRVDTDALARLLGVAQVRKADADEVREATGFAIGGTPPFGHVRSLDTCLDPHLATFDEVWAAAGTPIDVFPLRPDDLLRAGARQIGDFTVPA